MKKLAITTAAALGALAAVCAWGEWVYEGQWGRFGKGNGEFYEISGVDVAPGGRVYVVDWGNQRVQYFTPTGSYVGQWGSFGSGNGQFDCPDGIAVSASRKVYVVDVNNYRIQYFTATGSCLGKWGLPVF